jgi:hypothetical protein
MNFSNFQLGTDVTLPPWDLMSPACVCRVCVFMCHHRRSLCFHVLPQRLFFFRLAYRRSILTFFFSLTRAKFFEILYGKTFFSVKSCPDPIDPGWTDPGRPPTLPMTFPGRPRTFLTFHFSHTRRIFFPELLFFPSQERKFSEILLGKTFFSPKKKEKVRKFWLCTDGSRRVPGGPPWPGLSRSCIFQLFPTLCLFLP